MILERAPFIKKIIVIVLAFTMILTCTISNRMYFHTFAAEEDVSGEIGVYGYPEQPEYVVMVIEGGGTATCAVRTEGSDTVLCYNNVTSGEYTELNVNGKTLSIDSGITVNVYSSAINADVENGGAINYYGACDGSIVVENGGTAQVLATHNNGSNISVRSGGKLIIANGATINNLSSADVFSGSVNNSGTMKFYDSTTFTYTGSETDQFVNNGEIKAGSFNLSSNFSDSETASYSVKTSFTKGNFDLNGTVIPSNSALWDNEEVTIKSAGGKTVVKLDDVTITKTVAVDTTAGEFVPKPTITFAGWPTNIYEGQTINYKDYIQTDMGTATITFADATDSDGLVYGPEYSKAPTTAGKHRVTVTVPASTSYREGSNSYIFNIKYLTGVGYCTVDQEPVKNDGYSEFYNTPITLRAPDGFVIASVGGESCDLTSTYTISEDGYYMGQTGGVFERVSDGARTESGWLYPSYFVIDHTPPQIVQSSARDQDGVAISTEIKNGVTLNARGVTFTIHDSVYNFGNTLSSVTVDGEPIFVNTDEGNAEVSLKRTFPGKETHQIIAKDDLGNTSTWNITLKYLPIATPATPFTVSGTEGKNGYYKSDVTLIPVDGFLISDDVNGTFKDTLLYKSDMENVYLKDKVAGLYTDPIPVSFHIDKSNPAFSTAKDESGTEYEIADGLEVHAKKLSFTVSDSNLVKVTINGEEVAVNDGTADVELSLAKGTQDFEVYAEDIAGNSKSATITIEYLKDVGTATVSAADTFVGVEVSPVVTTNSNGEFTLYYKKSGTSDETYTTVKPNSIGTYYVQARIPATDLYTAVTAEDTFEIGFLPAPSPSYSLEGEKDANGNFSRDIIINAPEGYLISDSFAEGYSDSFYFTAGLDTIYLVRISDGALTAGIDFKENFINETTLTVSAEDTYVGIPVNPVVTTNSFGEIMYYYKEADASDDTYSAIPPVAAGKYTVQARVAARGYYTAKTAEATFEISYLPDPQETFTITATEGKNNFYTSDVEINAPKGYKISDSADGPFKSSITYTEGMDKIYLMRDDGALTEAIVYKEKYQIDKVVPEASKAGTLTNKKTLKTRLIDIKNGMSIYADTLDFSIFDENLATLTINGETVEFNEKTAKILLDADNKTSKFNIVAEDKAGNTTSLSVVLKATWLENNIIPAGAKITLEAGQVYNLEGGKWTVSGDSTVYYGGNSFCVDGTKDCVFTETK